MIDRATGLALGFLAFYLGLVVVTPGGLWVADETVYFAAVETLTREGSLVVDNGYAEFRNRALLFNDLMKPGPHGAVSQYPSGYSVLAAPFYLVFGVKGVMALNAVAAALCVWLTYRTSRLLFDSARVAHVAALLLGLCSFLVIYAKAFWPHALAAVVVLGSSWLALRAIRAPRNWRRDSLLAGLVLGLGISIRVDVVLIAPALLAVTLVHARRPVAMSALALAGTLPGVAAATWFNWLKFQALSPMYYGTRRGAGGDIGSYLWLLAGFGLFFVLCIAIRHAGGRRAVVAAVLAALAVALAGVAAVPRLQPVEDGLLRQVQGFCTLWIDLRQLGEQGRQATVHEDGTLTIFGLYKKAVAQSMPWIGIVALLLVRRPAPEARFGLAVCTLALLLWTPLFAQTSWHGGFASNMRYLLPVMPFVCILAARAFCLLRPVPRPVALLAWAVGLVAALGAILLIAPSQTQPAEAVVQHVLPLAFLAVLAGLSLLAGLGAVFALLTQVAFAAAIWLGLVNTYGFDLRTDIARRSYNARAAEVMAALPGNSFVYSVVYEPLVFQIRRGDPIAARNRRDETLDPALIDAALDAGYSVHVQTRHLLDQALAARPDLVAVRLFEEAEWMWPLWRVERSE